MLAPSQRAILSTAVAKIESTSGKNSASCRLILDSGSQRSYITPALAEKLNLVPFGKEKILIGSFGSASIQDAELPVVHIRLCTKFGESKELTVNIYPEPFSAPIRKERLDTRQFEFIKGLKLAEPLKDEAEDIQVDLLIGSDYYHDLVGDRRITLAPGLYLVQSVFGWVINGRVDTSGTGPRPSATLFATSQPKTTSDFDVTKFWRLELIGITDSAQIPDDEIAMRKVTESMTFDGDRYHVRFPWKEPTPDLPGNYELALGRLNSLEKRLEKEPDVRKKICGNHR